MHRFFLMILKQNANTEATECRYSKAITKRSTDMEQFKRIIHGLLFPHLAVVLLSIPAAAALLIYTFAVAGESSPVAYPSYVLSAYSLHHFLRMAREEWPFHESAYSDRCPYESRFTPICHGCVLPDAGIPAPVSGDECSLCCDEICVRPAVPLHLVRNAGSLLFSAGAHAVCPSAQCQSQWFWE